MGCLQVCAITQFLENYRGSLLAPVGDLLEPLVNAYEGSMKMERRIRGVGTEKSKPDAFPI